MRSRRQTQRVAAVLAAGVLLLGACGYNDTTVPGSQDDATSEAPPAAAPVECDNATQSYTPNPDRAAARKQLKRKGLLVVGVSADTIKLGFANPFEKFEIQGFDIDVARDIAEALDVDLRLEVITAAQRIPLLESGDVDIVVRNMTMNCTRWEQIGFSAVYYQAAQKVLVRSDDVADFEQRGVASLAKKKVCAPTGSTSIDNITTIEPEAEAVGAPNHTGCLVKFQQGEVDAITGDDTVLAGLAAQDPYAKVPEQKNLSTEPYGVGVAKDNRDLIAFINSVLDERRENGAWQRSYDTWLEAYLGDAKPPKPVYGR